MRRKEVSGKVMLDLIPVLGLDLLVHHRDVPGEHADTCRHAHRDAAPPSFSGKQDKLLDTNAPL